MSTAGPASARRSAGERREEVVTEAIRHFARSGYHAASTDAIARDAGISQPYLFRLFGTKRELFVACHERVHGRIWETFHTAAEGVPAEGRLPAMGEAYRHLLTDRDTLLFQMQSYAACADPDIQVHVRTRFAELVEAIRGLSGAGEAEIWSFFSAGMLLNVVASLGLETLVDSEPWVAGWMDPGTIDC